MHRYNHMQVPTYYVHKKAIYCIRTGFKTNKKWSLDFFLWNIFTAIEYPYKLNYLCARTNCIFREIAKTRYILYMYNVYVHMYHIGSVAKRSGTFNRLPIRGKSSACFSACAFFSVKLFKKRVCLFN